MKYKIYFTAILFSVVTLATAQSSAIITTIDTMDMVNPAAKLICERTPDTAGSEQLSAKHLLVDGKSIPLNDTTLFMADTDFYKLYFKKKGAEEVLFRKLKIDGGRYESHRTRYTITKAAQVKIEKCIYSNIKYPREAIENLISGDLKIDFYLNTRGCVQDLEIKSKAHPLLIAETKRAIKECDCQFPVLTDGKGGLFPTYISFPINFRLD